MPVAWTSARRSAPRCDRAASSCTPTVASRRLGLVEAGDQLLHQFAVLGDACPELRDLCLVGVHVGRCRDGKELDRRGQGGAHDRHEHDGSHRASTGPARQRGVAPRAGLDIPSPATSEHNGQQSYAFGCTRSMFESAAECHEGELPFTARIALHGTYCLQEDRTSMARVRALVAEPSVDPSCSARRWRTNAGTPAGSPSPSCFRRVGQPRASSRRHRPVNAPAGSGTRKRRDAGPPAMWAGGDPGGPPSGKAGPAPRREAAAHPRGPPRSPRRGRCGAGEDGPTAGGAVDPAAAGANPSP